jgi:hypothetical protein
MSLMKVLSYRNDCGCVSCDVRVDRYSGLVSDGGSGLGCVGFRSFRNNEAVGLYKVARSTRNRVDILRSSV